MAVSPGLNPIGRMNGAVIRGFEEDVGTKTSFYGFTTNSMKNALVWYTRDGFTQIPQSPVRMEARVSMSCL